MILNCFYVLDAMVKKKILISVIFEETESIGRKNEEEKEEVSFQCWTINQKGHIETRFVLKHRMGFAARLKTLLKIKYCTCSSS